MKVSTFQFHFAGKADTGKPPGPNTDPDAVLPVRKRAGVTAERLSQVMKLIWLAPAIQEEVLFLPGGCGRHALIEQQRVQLNRFWDDYAHGGHPFRSGWSRFRQ